MTLDKQKDKDTLLTVKQDKFVCSYIATGSAPEAYRMAFGGTHKNSSQKAYQVLKKPHVKARVAELRAAMGEYIKMEARDLMKIWQEIATADPHDIVQVRQIPCPRCYIPDGQPKLTSEPQEDCLHCGGEGARHINVTPTAKLKGSAKRLYAGAKMGKYGIEVQLRDQDAATTNIARYLGMFKEQVEITGKDGTPIQAISTITDDPIIAMQVYQELIAGKLPQK